MRAILLSLLWVYQYGISPLFPPRCRFFPTCSAYAREAIIRYGAWWGMWLAVRRLLRCHPLCQGGVDEVP
nr:membrane protein insertion efficiency factor YidD [Pasteuria penetrans]